MVPDLIKLLLDEADPQPVDDRAARIEEEAEREGMMLRRAARKYSSGGRKHTETKYDRVFNRRDDAKKQFRKVASDGATSEGCVPVSETPIRDILPDLPKPSPVQDTPRTARPQRVKKPAVQSQFRRMQARRLGKE